MIAIKDRRCTRNVPKCTLGSKGQSQHPPGNPVGQGEHWEVWS